ncbi:hypothetical protein JG688_00006949 [Phytophthora aleatoria]|uniref:Uncharacterized protein n=1 Tax=Phytophthora aleatoria TaxID=2496075 RepID=A0A8J5M5I4_9STRA|nr:hypothetical protein JG688_00006949 [Phytophthora aleatoria]
MPASITVDNLQEDEVLSYPLVLLEGRITDLHPTDNLFLDARLDDLRSSLWPISPAGNFKAFVLLPSPGKFAITLQLTGIAHRIFCIEYQPRLTRFVVKFHYQICSDADNRDGFDAPLGVDNSDAVAIAKIRFNALLLQMATAELMHAAGLPRLTFAMQFAPDGLPDVTLLRCRFANAHARSVDGQKLIKLVQHDIEAAGLDDHPELEFKHAVVLGCLVGVSIDSSTPFSPDARVLVDDGAYDVRLEAATPEFGIESVVLVKKNNSDNLDKHAWTWNQHGMPYPRVWRVPHKMLEDYADSKRTLFEEYLVGAINSGGAYSKTAAPVLRQ